MEMKEVKNTKERPVPNGMTGANVPDQERDDSQPRVVDKRRFLRLLNEDVSGLEPVEEKPRVPSFVEELQNKLKTSEERLLDYAEKARQARQEMESEIDSVRDRLHRNMAEQLERSKADFISKFLEILDNLKRAVESAEATQHFEGLLDGIKATTLLFERRLEAEGVSVIDAMGEPFDPRLHEAVETVTVEPESDGLVVKVLQPGYRLGDETLIRPARVCVGQCETKPGSKSEDPTSS